ncbi:MAG: hypothetical protein JNJ61_08505 [Anaerolineae bacterium]|nr:hypothetical protein [Anaerolineae bacterium]
MAVGADPNTNSSPARSPEVIRYFIFMLIFTIGLWWAGNFYINSPAIEFSDELSHYFIARDAIEEPLLFLNDWGRPGNTLAYAIPSSFGFEERRLATLYVFSTLIVFFTTLIAKRLKLSWQLVPLMLWFQPWFYQYAFQSLTVIPFTLFLVAGILAWLIGQMRWASLLIGMLPLVRHESLPLVLLWCIYLYNPNALNTFRAFLHRMWIQNFDKRSVNENPPPEEPVNVAATAPEEPVNVAATAPEEPVNVAATASEEPVNVAATPPPEQPENKIKRFWLVLCSLLPYFTWNILAGAWLNEIPVFKVLGLVPYTQDCYPPRSILHFIEPTVIGVGWVIFIISCIFIIYGAYRFFMTISRKNPPEDLSEEESKPYIWWVAFVVYFAIHAVILLRNDLGSGGYIYFLLPLAPAFAICAVGTFSLIKKVPNRIIQIFIKSVSFMLVLGAILGFQVIPNPWSIQITDREKDANTVAQAVQDHLQQFPATKMRIFTTDPLVWYQIERMGYGEHLCPQQLWNVEKGLPILPTLVEYPALLITESKDWDARFPKLESSATAFTIWNLSLDGFTARPDRSDAFTQLTQLYTQRYCGETPERPDLILNDEYKSMYSLTRRVELPQNSLLFIGRILPILAQTHDNKYYIAWYEHGVGLIAKEQADRPNNSEAILPTIDLSQLTSDELQYLTQEIYRSPQCGDT